MTTSDYLTQLQQDRDDLVDNLTTMGITGLTGDETFTELVPEVLNISGGDLDWSAIGYSNTPQFIIEGYNYAQEILESWIPSESLSQKFKNNKNLIIMPLVNTSTAKNTSYMFDSCIRLLAVPLLDTSNVTSFAYMFHGCTALQTIPEFNVSSLTTAFNCFANCNALSDESLNNILGMCANATSYTQTKTLAKIGLTNSNYPVSRIEVLPNYQDFINAGWTIGY